MNSIKWKVLLIIAVIAFSIVLLYPPSKKLKLGLDLRGGMHLILEVQTDEAIRIQTDQVVAQLRNSFKESSLKFEKISRVGINQVNITGTLFENEQKIRDSLDDNFKEWEYSFSGTQVTMKLKPLSETELREQSVNQALETIRRRVDDKGVSEPVIQKEGMEGNRIMVQLPGMDDPESVKELIRNTAMLEWKEVVAGPFQSEAEALKQYNGTLPDDLQVYKTNPRRMDKAYYVLKAEAIVSGKDLKNSRRAQGEYGDPAVGFSFSSQGAAKFERFTAANIGKRLSILLDKKIESVATIQSAISYDGILTGRFTIQEVDDLVLVLRSGALPASMKELENRTIGPSLGADSIRKGLYACLSGFFLVVLFMLFYYRGAGINSILALAMNMLILMAIMAYFRATLTLPGFAGIILGVGMAVDANVLIFERIKEDLMLGKSPKSAIENGFKKAFWTIFDSNLTTVISAVFLFQFGTGPIKGFAVTLIIGIVASMFTAIFVSRVIFDITYSGKKKLKDISI